MKKTESNEFAMRLIPSVMSILLCLGLLCTTSLAYFTETVTSGGSKIASASYNTKVALLNIQQPASNSFIISRPGSAEENTVSDNSAVADTPIVDKDGNIVVDAGGGAAPVDPTIIAGGSIETSSSQSNNSLEGEIETVNAGAEFTPEEIVDPYTCSEDGICLYTFSITAEGTAENGYCEIRVGDGVYRTVQIPVGKAITVDIVAERGTEIEFVPQMGTSAGYAAALMSLDDEETDDGLIGDGEVIEYSGEASLFEEPSDEIDGGDLDGDGSGDGDDDDTIINGGDLDRLVPGENLDEAPGENPADNPSENFGDNSSEEPGEKTVENSGENPSENPDDDQGGEQEEQGNDGPDAQAEQDEDDIPTVEAG